MFTSIEDFKQNWTYESSCTGKLMKQFTDKSLSQPVANDHRTLGRMAWHIIQSIPEMFGRTGLKVDGPAPTAPVPTSAVEFKNAYDIVASSLLEQVTKHWDEKALYVEDDMYGEKWKRGQTLAILISHEVHHRGQMTVLMRQAGLAVPGVYGPSKDEWAQYGGNPPEI
jgi:uncharacterized damage-inducible protein DinB